MSACTQEQKLKKSALQEVRITMGKAFQDEATSGFAGRSEMVQKYTQTLEEQTEIDAIDVVESGLSVKVTVEVKSVPQSVRSAMVSIVSAHSESKDRNLNIPDSIVMIKKAQGLAADAVEKKTIVIEFVKDAQSPSGWRVLNPAIK